MKTITLKYFDGQSINCNIDDNIIITILDIIKHVHSDNNYIYSIYNFGKETRLALDTNINQYVIETSNEQSGDSDKELFILQENIPSDLLNIQLILTFNSYSKPITTYTEFVYTTNISIDKTICSNKGYQIKTSDLLLLQHCKNLHTLSIICDQYDQNRIDVEPIQYLTSLHTLSLIYCSNLDSVLDNFMDDIMLNIKILNIKTYNENMSGFYNNLPELEELSFHIDEEYGISFNKKHTLKKVYFKSRGISDEPYYSPLAELINLEELTLNYDIEYGDRHDCGYKDSIEISLLNNLPKLRVLSIINFNIRTTHELNDIYKLEELSLDTCRLDDLSFMKNLINLKSLQLTHIYNEDVYLINEVDPIPWVGSELDFNSIQYLNNLEILKLYECSIYISTGIIKLSKLRELYINDTKYTEEKIKKIKPNMTSSNLRKYLDDL